MKTLIFTLCLFSAASGFAEAQKVGFGNLREDKMGEVHYHQLVRELPRGTKLLVNRNIGTASDFTDVTTWSREVVCYVEGAPAPLTRATVMSVDKAKWTVAGDENGMRAYIEVTFIGSPIRASCTKALWSNETTMSVSDFLGESGFALLLRPGNKLANQR